jgi:hypothetical protein
MDLYRFVAIHCDMRSLIDEPAPVAIDVGVERAKLEFLIPNS